MHSAPRSRARRLRRTITAAKQVRAPLRFVTFELGSRRLAAHRLRDSGLTVYLRHRTHDLDIFKEVFGTEFGPKGYEPPAPVAATLDSRPAPTALDLGGNIGLFGVYALGRWPAMTLRSFEPDRVPASTPLEDGERIMVRTVDLFEEDHDVDLIKMDIEGAEWSILTDPRLPGLGADAIVLEWHRSGCPEPDPRAAASRLLRAAGYAHQQETQSLSHTGVVWGWRDEPG